MPESVRSIAKQFIDTHQKNKPVGGSRNVYLVANTKTTATLQNSQSARNLNNDPNINRSMSQKFMQAYNQMSQGTGSQITQEPGVASIFTRKRSSLMDVMEPQQDVASDKLKVSQVSMTTYNARGGFRNSKMPTINKSEVQGSRISPPRIYKEYLPNIIKKQIAQEEAMTQKQFNNSIFQKKKLFEQLKNKDQNNHLQVIENIKQRHDVSYLNEANSNVSPMNIKQPTILTTGNAGKDVLLEVTLGLKKIGQSMIDLPDSLQELQDLMKQTFSQQFDQLNSEDAEERFFQKYLDEHFKAIDLFKKGGKDSYSLKDYAQQNSFTSRLLKSHKAQSPNKLFNINDRNVEQMFNYDAPKINVLPDNLQLVSNKVLQMQQKDANNGFFNTSANKGKQTQRKNKAKTDLNSSLVNNNSSYDKLPLRDRIFKTLEDQNHLETQYQNHSQEKAQSPLGHLQNSKKLNGLQPLGNPSSRQDAILLQDWLNLMIKAISATEFEADSKQEMFNLIQLTMNICIQELARQVSVQCLERGNIIKKVFQAYINLINYIYLDHQRKRKQMKMDYSSKLDKYIIAQDDQIKFYKEQVSEYKAGFEKLQQQLEENENQLSYVNMLNQKFKKKCWTLQKDVEGQQRKMRFMDFEITNLKKKLKDLADKAGEELSEVDESDRLAQMHKVEKEFEDKQKDQDETQNEEEIINDIPDREVIKEDDKGTDMKGFEYYLKTMYGDPRADAEIQTNKLIKKNRKIGVNPHKIGMMVTEQTYTDPRMFMTAGGVQIMRAMSTIEVNKVMEEAAANLSISEILEDELDQQTQSVAVGDDITDPDDKTIHIIGDGNDMEYVDLEFNNKSYNKALSTRGFKEIQIDNLDKDDLQDYQTLQDLSPSKRRNSQNRNKNNQNFNSKGQQRRQSVFDMIAVKLKRRITMLMGNEQFQSLEQTHNDLYLQIVANMQDAVNEIAAMNNELLEKNKLVKQKEQENQQKAMELEQIQKKADTLEMDNYMLREQIQNLLDLNEEEKLMIDQLIQLIESEGFKIDNIADLKNALVQLNDKITNQVQNKSLLQLLEDKPFWQESLRNTQQNFSDAHLTQNIGVRKNTDIRDDQSFIMTQNAQSTFGIKHQDEDIEDGDGQEDQDAQDHEQADGQNANNSDKKKNRKTPFKVDYARSKPQTKFKLFNLGLKKNILSKKKKQHQAFKILNKLQSKDLKDLKDMMPKKMLLRTITSVYQEKAAFDLTTNGQMQATSDSFKPNQTGQQQNQQQGNYGSLLEWLYDSFMHKYGLKNVAEKKFVQLIASCIYHKDHTPRIRLFGRFLEIYLELSLADYNRYNELTETFIQQVLNFKIDEDEEHILLPYLERMKVIVTPDQQKNIKHLKIIKEAIDYDRFAEFILDNYVFLQQEKEQMIRDVFLAIDFDMDQLISFQDFSILMKVMHPRPTNEIIKLFEENAETALDPQRPQLKHLTLENFTQMAIDKDLFNPRVQVNFANSKNIDTDFKIVKEKEAQIIDALRKRLVVAGQDSFLEFRNYLEDFHNSLKDPFSTRVGWLSFRVIDDLTKRIYLSKISDNFMPIVLKNVGMRMAPNSQIQVPLTVTNFYDTL